RIDPASATRIQPRDTLRLVPALEAYLVTGRTRTSHFAATTPPSADLPARTGGPRPPRAQLEPRVPARVAAPFPAGLVGEVESLVAAGVPLDAHAFSGLVYRQIVEMIRGVRALGETRDLIVRENMHYARRQMVW